MKVWWSPSKSELPADKWKDVNMCSCQGSNWTMSRLFQNKEPKSKWSVLWSTTKEGSSHLTKQIFSWELKGWNNGTYGIQNFSRYLSFYTDILTLMISCNYISVHLFAGCVIIFSCRLISMSCQNQMLFHTM